MGLKTNPVCSSHTEQSSKRNRSGGTDEATPSVPLADPFDITAWDKEVVRRGIPLLLHSSTPILTLVVVVIMMI